MNLTLFRRIAFVWTFVNILYICALVMCYKVLFVSAIDYHALAAQGGKAISTIFVLNSLLSILVAYDWALTLDYHDLYSRMLTGLLVCACSSFVFAFTILDVIQRDFTEYPLFLLICHTACMKIFGGSGDVPIFSERGG